MERTIEDFSTKIEMVNPENGYRWTDYVELVVKDWGYSTAACTFNSDGENTAKVLMKALEKYKKLLFVTGVTGGTKNDLIQHSVMKNMEKLYGGKFTVEYSGKRYASAKYELVEN